MKKKKDLRIFVPFCAAVLLLAALAVVIVLSFFGDDDRVAEQYVQYAMTANGEAMFSLYPEEAIDYVARETGLREQDMRSNMQHKLSLWLKEEITDACGTLSEYSFEVKNRETVDKATVSEMETNFGVNVSSAKLFTLAYHAKGSAGEKSGEISVGVAKIDGQWYLYNLLLLLE